ncbi:class I lanthipeptide [uncultured Aquimarina sp.]|uniref:class I lanthipeptide n=1 Tax=uncultured Aquimarina sp. TaxID=575652 RepID=UPI0026307288|nr:class I lanthipeptide [uncultured Aquimarina sp.]
MKTKQEQSITFKKLTIAKINTSSMHKIKGGDCEVIEPDMGTHESICICDNPY